MMVTSGAMVRRVRIDAPDGRFLFGDDRPPVAVPCVYELRAVRMKYEIGTEFFRNGFSPLASPEGGMVDCGVWEITGRFGLLDLPRQARKVLGETSPAADSLQWLLV